MENNPYAILIIALSPEDGGGYMGVVPDLQGCMSDGETAEEALRNTTQAILEWIDASKEAGREIPAPGSSQVRAFEIHEGLVQKVAEQKRTVEQLEDEIKALRIELASLTERMAHSRPSWVVEPMPSVPAIKRAQKHDAVH